MIAYPALDGLNNASLDQHELIRSTGALCMTEG